VRHLRTLGTLCIAIALAVPLLTTTAQAGCGCDHPPPAFAPVMPPFGAAGKLLTLNVDSNDLSAGVSYDVEFKMAKGWSSMFGNGLAIDSGTVQVNVPGGLLGPVSITIHRGRKSQAIDFDDSLFTALALPHRMPAGDSLVLLQDFTGTVSADGTLYIAVDLTDVRAASQFAFVMADMPILFGPDDVLFYNRDGVDLTLFTLAVDDPNERQWGSYYGWDVNQDSGIVGTVYETKVGQSPEPGTQSDMLTYWRHEFLTYALAHEPGGSHEVDEHGMHPDGTLHIDHSQLLIAIRGTFADGESLAPGKLTMDLVATIVAVDNPIEPEIMAERAYSSTVYSESDTGLTSYKASLSGTTDSLTLESDTTVEKTLSVDTTDTSTKDTATTDTSTTTTKVRGKRSKR